MPTTRSRWPSPSQSTANGRVQILLTQSSPLPGLLRTGMMSGSPSVPLRTSALRNVPSALPCRTWNSPAMSLFHAGVGAGEDVAPAVAVEVHKLWSRAGASPHARDLGHRAVGLEPVARGELAVAQVLVDADLPAVELPDEQVLLAVAVDVGPAGAGPARAPRPGPARRPP